MKTKLRKLEMSWEQKNRELLNRRCNHEKIIVFS